MSIEIIENIRALEREKGIEQDTLVQRSRMRCSRRTRRRRAPPAMRRSSWTRRASSASSRSRSRPTSRSVCSTRRASLRSTELERIEEETGEKQHTLVSDNDLDST